MEQTVVVTVRDTGIGIPAEHQARLFEMFSQVDQGIDRSEGGLGIGLALVKGLVEMHGGTVRRFTAAGRGWDASSWCGSRWPGAYVSPTHRLRANASPAQQEGESWSWTITGTPPRVRS